MSSRNEYLSHESRNKAKIIFETLQSGITLINDGPIGITFKDSKIKRTFSDHRAPTNKPGGYPLLPRTFGPTPSHPGLGGASPTGAANAAPGRVRVRMGAGGFAIREGH